MVPPGSTPVKVTLTDARTLRQPGAQPGQAHVHQWIQGVLPLVAVAPRQTGELGERDARESGDHQHGPEWLLTVENQPPNRHRLCVLHDENHDRCSENEPRHQTERKSHGPPGAALAACPRRS